MRPFGAVLVFLKVLVRRHEVERLMGSDLVIEALIAGERTVEGLDGEVAVVAVPELDVELAAVGDLDGD